MNQDFTVPPKDIRPATLPYQLYERLRDMIIDGTLRAGAPLREQDLEKKLATSRGPIREALRLLELRGLVEHTPRRGFRVVSFSEREIADIYELRAELESYAVQQLAKLDSLDLLLDRLEACNERMSQCFKSGDVRGYLEQNRAFHDAIVQAGGNMPLRDTLRRLTEIAQPLRFNVLSQNFAGSRALESHRKIVQLLRDNALAEAAKEMRYHINHNIPAVLKAYAAVRHGLVDSQSARTRPKH